MAGLAYEDTRSNWSLEELLDRPTVFEPCPGEDTQFNGGVVATRPGCLDIDAIAPDGTEMRIVLPMGVPQDSC